MNENWTKNGFVCFFYTGNNSFKRKPAHWPDGQTSQLIRWWFSIQRVKSSNDVFTLVYFFWLLFALWNKLLHVLISVHILRAIRVMNSCCICVSAAVLINVNNWDQLSFFRVPLNKSNSLTFRDTWPLSEHQIWSWS